MDEVVPRPGWRGVPAWAMAQILLAIAWGQAPLSCDLKAAQRLLHQEQFSPALGELAGCGEDLQAFRIKGMVFHGLYAADSAVVYLKKSYDRGMRDDAVRTRLAEAFLWKKDFRDADEILGGVQDRDGTDYLKVLARKHEILGEFDEALKLYNRVIPVEKLPYGTMERKAILLSWMKRYNESISEFDAILREPVVSSPLKIRCRIRRAEVISWTGHFNPALMELDRVLAMDRKNVDARLVKGRILEWKGDYKSARAAYRQVLTIDSTNDPAKLRMEKLGWVK